jgi:hypothetical protein
MQCQAVTKKGTQCRNMGGPTGYCVVHGGSGYSRRSQRKYFERQYAQMTPEQQREHDSFAGTVTWIIALLFIGGAMMYGCATGDWEGVQDWLR